MSDREETNRDIISATFAFTEEMKTSADDGQNKKSKHLTVGTASSLRSLTEWDYLSLAKENAQDRGSRIYLYSFTDCNTHGAEMLSDVYFNRTDWSILFSSQRKHLSEWNEQKSTPSNFFQVRQKWKRIFSFVT